MNDPNDRPSQDTDKTAAVAAATDIAPRGRDEAKAADERTAPEDAHATDWERVAAMDEFKQLLAAKRRFILPATVFFIVYYFALPLLVGYAPELMKRPVWGPVNAAYLFALSQFFMAWFLAALYVRSAGRWDRLARRIIELAARLRGGR